MKRCFSALLLGLLLLRSNMILAGDLDSWNKGPNRQAILDYVKKVTVKGSPSFIPIEDRIAVFDNDGTLWTEKPIPIQARFAVDRVKALAPKHPEWKTQQPFQAVLQNDASYFNRMTETESVKLLAATHLGMTEDEFVTIVGDWFKTARDPHSGELLVHRVYQPLLELLSFLRGHDFKTYIVTGGGTEFVRAVAESAYGIPPEQVIGSSIIMKWEIRDGKSVFLRELKIAEPLNIDAGKPVNIQRIIGRAPVIAVGNSDGDLQMLQYASTNSYPSLNLLVHHDDAAREAAYDEGAEKILKEAKEKKWRVISMKNDFSRIYPGAIRPGG